MNINNKNYPALDLLECGLQPSKIDFPSKEIEFKFQSNIDYYIGAYGDIYSSFKKMPVVQYVGQDLVTLIDNYNYQNLWYLKNETPNYSGLLLFGGGAAYFVKISNKEKEKVVTWRMFVFGASQLLSYSEGGWRYEDLDNEKMWFSFKSFDSKKGLPNYSVHYPIQMVCDTLNYFRIYSTPIITKIAPGGKGVIEKLISNDSSFLVEAYGLDAGNNSQVKSMLKSNKF